jgi:hypothetical protein
MKGTACPARAGGCYRSFFELSLVPFFFSRKRKEQTLHVERLEITDYHSYGTINDIDR